MHLRAMGHHPTCPTTSKELWLTWLKQSADFRLSSSARPGYSDCHAGQLPAHHRRGRASYPLAGRHRLT
jgi:hypothetical protein